MKTVNDVRNEFLNFFAKKEHEIVASSSLVPQNDPTLMFINSGMAQFKNVFTGKETRPYTRATTSQKCVRAGGKHNDLDNVGYTKRHHTFFEMLGNFSFGDYFKEEAITYAWELITKNFQLNTDKLCVTVYHTDDEAFDIWKKVSGFHDDKIIRIPTDDNFWRMGDTGPCGPSTEIFYDHGDHIWGGPPGSPEEDGDRFIEIWNNVFMQYEQIDADTLIDLPNKCIDTGMGLERMAATLMGSNDNYAIDLIRDIIQHSADLTGVDPDGNQSVSHRVIADHLRTASFLIADGVMPSNEGRGYVLRRIMRRGMRHAHLLGAKDPLMHQLFPTLLGKMGEAYPELGRAEALITETLRGEEERFKRTLDRGLKLLDEETQNLSEGDSLDGATAFKLYDTFGFPLDLTQDALKSQGITVDTEGFDACMAEQKAKARASWSGSGDAAVTSQFFTLAEKIQPTDFLGYEVKKAQAKIEELLIINKAADFEDSGDVFSVPASIINNGSKGIIITNQTPFYAESGGQIGDTGYITVEDGSGKFKVTSTTKVLGKLWLHHGEVIEGQIVENAVVNMEVDDQRRTNICANHSATHLLHEALRRVLGDHVTQKGSAQDEQRTRFDISHPKAMNDDELAQVEEIITKQIAAAAPVTTRVMPIEEARETGAMALFGEKYDDEVRVVIMGTQQPGESKAFSVELCGGTHVKNTADIGRFKIISDSALSSGVRRLEALTGDRVTAYENQKAAQEQDAIDKARAENTRLCDELKSMGGSAEASTASDVTRLQKENKKLQKQIDDLRRSKATSGEADVKDIAGIKFTGKILDGFPAKDLKPMADDLKNQLGSGVIVLIATDEGKASIVVGVTDDLTDKVSAVDLVRVGSAALGGKGGGGRPDMAQAGGPNASAANDAVEAIETALAG